MRQTQTRTAIQTLPPNAVFQNASPSLTVPPSIANFPVGLAHDARNVLAAMDIYCELLSGPGVLNPAYHHLADELRLLRDSSSGLMDRLLILSIHPLHGDQPDYAQGDYQQASHQPGSLDSSFSDSSSSVLPSFAEEASLVKESSGRRSVASVKEELSASHRMLSALAGPKVQVELMTMDAPEGQLRIASGDFTRVLINLIRNAAEAMGTGGRIQISVRRAGPELSVEPAVLISVEDNGPGIPLSLLEKIFDLNSVSDVGEQQKRRMSFRPRGLGLRIVRELVEGGGGIIRAGRLPERGSRFEIVLPFVT
jgi:signal transduction histidine kinase